MRSTFARTTTSIALLICGGLLSSCGGGGLYPDSTAKLTQIMIAPANPRIAKGASVKLVASGMFADGKNRPLKGTPIWKTSEASIVSVDKHGQVIGMAEGVAHVSATYGGLTSDTSINVGAPALLSITINPSQSSVSAGASEQLSATGKFSDGTIQDLTQSATWLSSGPPASVSSTGNVLGNSVGTVTVSATSASITGAANVAVAPPAVTAVNILPSTVSMNMGNSSPLQAIATLTDKTTLDISALSTWNSNAATVATVNAQGGVTGIGKGNAEISATYQGQAGFSSITVGPAVLVAISISANASSLPVGESEQLTATGRYSDGSVQDLTQSAIWVSSAAAATVSASGNLLAVAVGTTAINAASGSISGTANISITPAAVTAVNVVPTLLTISLGNSAPLQAIATLSDKTTRDVTATATWASAAPLIAIVNNSGSVASVARGSAQVSAAYQGLSGSCSITIGPPALNSLAVSLSQATLPAGESEQATANGKYSDGSIQNLSQSITWSSNTPAIATIGADGSVTAKTVGTTALVATSGGITGFANLTVIPAVPTGLSVVPSALSIVTGSNRQFQALATMSDGTSQDMTGAVTWSSMQTNIATISDTGVAYGMQPGTAIIDAQSNDITATANLTVMPLILVNYFSRLNAVNSGIDGTVELINPGLTSSPSLCAMVYVFDQSQELNECCGCSVSSDGLRTLSLLTDLTANPLTGVAPRAGEIKVVPSDPAQNPQCNPALLSPAGALAGWAQNPQGSDSTAQMTETQFRPMPMSSSEAGYLANMCSFLQKLGSGRGTCSCGSGE